MIVARGILSQAHTLVLLAIYLYDVSLMWYFASLALLGLIPNQIVWNLWVADRVEMRERTRFFAVLNLTIDCERIVLPVSVFLASPGASIWLCVVAGILSLIATAFVPESMPPADRCRQGGRQSGFLDGLRLVASDRRMKMLCIICLAGFSCMWGGQAIWYPWIKQRFGSSIRDIAPVLAVSALVDLVVQIFLVKPMTECFGFRPLVIFSFAAGMAYNLLVCIVPQLWYFYFLGIMGSFGTLCVPAVNAVFINLAQPGERAQVQALFAQLMGVTKALGPVVVGGIFSYSLSASFLKDSVFLASSMPFLFQVCLACFCIVILVRLPQNAFPECEQSLHESVEIEEVAS